MPNPKIIKSVLNIFPWNKGWLFIIFLIKYQNRQENLLFYTTLKIGIILNEYFCNQLGN